MKIYHSFWELKSNFNESVHDIHELSVLCALKNYGNINLITSEEGKEFLKDLPYTSIEIFEEYVPNCNLTLSDLLNKYKNIWSLSKIFAYNQISNKSEKFFHIDYDVFLFKRLPENYENAKIVCQSFENENILNELYNVVEFQESCKYKSIYNSNIDWAYNLGIVGGSDLEFFKFYFIECLNLLLNNEERFWIESESDKSSCLIEQYWFTQCLENRNIKPELIFPDKNYSSWHDYPTKFQARSLEIGYTHLMGLKYDYNRIKKQIHEKIRQLKFD